VTAGRRRALAGVAAVAAVAAAGALIAGVLVGRYLVPDEGGTAAAHPTAPAGEPSAVDVGFTQDMATHHAQAIRMADVVRGRVRPDVDAVAAHVFQSQVRESGVLQGWLQLWGAPPLPTGRPMTWMRDHDGGGERGDASPPMPGMASQDEVNRLSELSGTELELSFLQLMVRHHEGGILMAQAAAKRADVQPVRSLAAAIALEQQQEITLMRQLLRKVDT
jgi:uncharacterized protein (DUF305 family)